MKCLVLLLSVVACAKVAGAAAASCALAEQFFSRHNVSADDSDGPGPICGGQCCGRGREAHLRSALRRVAVSSAAASSHRTAELLLSTRRTLQNHLLGLSQTSQNSTTVLFLQLYRSYATRTHAPLNTFYEDIRMLLRSKSEDEAMNGDLNSRPPKDMVMSSRTFFRDIFPIVSQNAWKLESKQFTPEYEACLKDAYDVVKPFGNEPQQLGTSLSRSLEAARALLQMLAVGAGALTTTQDILTRANDACSDKLLRAVACSRCKGHEARPCRNYCLNVARGCIGSLVSELDGPWASYVEGVERLTRVDADVVLRGLEEQISKAIMYVLENKAILESKVRNECGPPSTMESPELPNPRPTPAMRRDDLRAPPPDTELLQFAATLASTKKLFYGLADKLCEDPDFMYEGNENCWNGDAIGEYKKALVPSASLSDQKYNPEIGNPPSEPRVAALGDRLRQARLLLASHLGTNEMHAESFMQGDEAGEEGSGSGRNYPDDDSSYDDGSGDDGSGSSDMDDKTFPGEETTHPSVPKTGSATSSRPLFSIILSMAIMASVARCIT